MRVFLFFNKHGVVIIVVRVRVVLFTDPVPIVSTAMTTGPSNRILLHIVNCIAYKRTYGLTVFTILLFNSLLYASAIIHRGLFGSGVRHSSRRDPTFLYFMLIFGMVRFLLWINMISFFIIVGPIIGSIHGLVMLDFHLFIVRCRIYVMFTAI